LDSIVKTTITIVYYIPTYAQISTVNIQ